MDAFDGAGREYRQPSYKKILVLGVVLVVLIVLVWVAGAWVLGMPDAPVRTPAP